jgi:hypothetical protein
MFYGPSVSKFFLIIMNERLKVRKASQQSKSRGATYIKYPDAIQLLWLLECSAFPMVERATASVVWSMSATRSTVAQARKIYTF